MSALNFPKIGMTEKDFLIHFTQKIENTKWLGHLFEYSQSGQNVREDRPETLEEVQPITEPFASFPYRWEVRKSKVSTQSFNFHVEEHTQFDKAKPNFIFSIPFHKAAAGEMRRIVRAIEDQSFGPTAEASHALVQKQVAVVIGLNNCKSFDPARNHAFIRQVKALQKEAFASHVSLTIHPFFWGYPWIPKTARELGQQLVFRHVFIFSKCYRIANSYFRYFRGTKESLWISRYFSPEGSPSEKVIPYQQIRDKILHSTALRTFFTACKSNLKYVVSLDGDFTSLKSVSSSLGLLTHYQALMKTHHQRTQRYPDVLSTGYEPPATEKNEMIKAGIALDRSIRAVILAVFVYMPEPNFCFRVTCLEDLEKLSWIGSATMDTESRRLIACGLALGIFDSDDFVFSNRGGIQTAIDSAWRTKSVNKYMQLAPHQLKQKGVQKALRGIRQSFADPQIWATNVYAGLQVSVSAYMSDCITPIKGIRELFDPITVRNVRFGADGARTTDFESLFKIFPIYLQYMENSITSEDDFDTIAAEFVEEASIVGKTAREGWENFMATQLSQFQEYRNLLLVNYTPLQLNKIIKAAIATGRAIKGFYQEHLQSKA